MEQVKRILDGSLLWRALMALCAWMGGQWRASRVVQWFLHPALWGSALSQGSVFYRLWALARSALCWLYERLGLERLFHGSVFLHPFFWCALPVAVAPLLSVFRPSLIVLALVLVSYASLLLVLVRDRKRELVWSPINRYVLLYAAVYLVGTIFSVNLSVSLQPGLLTVCFILFPVALGSAVDSRRQLDGLLSVMVLAGTAVSLYGILQYLFGWGYQSAAWVDSDMFSSISFRVASTLENPNMLGQYLILIIPLGGAKLLSAKDWGRRTLWLCCCGIMCLCMLLTSSRGAWLGLLFAGALFLILLKPKLMLAIPFALLALYFLLPQWVILRFTSIGNMADNSTSYRVSIWLGTLDMLKDYWLCGIGPGTGAFNAVYPAYSYSGAAAQHSHSLFLQILCDAGICALAVFLVVIFLYVRMLCSALARERDWTVRLLQIAFLTGVCGFLIQGMADYSFYNYRLMFIFWAYLGLGSLCARRDRLAEGGIGT